MSLQKWKEEEEGSWPRCRWHRVGVIGKGVVAASWLCGALEGGRKVVKDKGGVRSVINRDVWRCLSNTFLARKVENATLLGISQKYQLKILLILLISPSNRTCARRHL